MKNDDPTVHPTVCSETPLAVSLKSQWSSLVAQGKVGYDAGLLRTRILDPQDGRMPFFLVVNEGRRSYIERVAERRATDECPFCSDGYRRLTMCVQGTLRVLPNTFPCLPYQFVLCAEEHAKSMGADILEDGICFASDSGFKVYWNAPGTGGSYTHVVLQASQSHCSAPLRDITSIKCGAPIAATSTLRADHLDHAVFVVRVSGTDPHELATGVGRLVERLDRPVNLLFKGLDAFLIPRTGTEITAGFGRWRFGVLEVTGTFICQDQATFDALEYGMLERALAEITITDRLEQIRIVEAVARLVCEPTMDGLSGSSEGAWQ